MEKVKFIYADLHKAPDGVGHVLLTTLGTSSDIQRHRIEFKEGESFWFWADNLPGNPLVFKAKVSFSKDYDCWIAEYDPHSVKSLSESEFKGEYSAEEITNEKGDESTAS